MKLKKLIILIIGVLTLTACSSEVYQEKIEENIQEENEDFNFIMKEEKLNIDNSVSNLIVEQTEGEKIKITIEKNIHKLNQGKINLKEITCNLEGNTLAIKNDIEKTMNVKSADVITKIFLPKSIKDVNLTSSIGNIILNGDYEIVNMNAEIGDISINGTQGNLQLNTEVGNIEYTGASKISNMISNVGKINCTFEHIQPMNQYTLEAGIGAIHIKVPKASKLNLEESSISELDIAPGISESSEGAKFIINGLEVAIEESN